MVWRQVHRGWVASGKVELVRVVGCLDRLIDWYLEG